MFSSTCCQHFYKGHIEVSKHHLFPNECGQTLDFFCENYCNGMEKANMMLNNLDLEIWKGDKNRLKT